MKRAYHYDPTVYRRYGQGRGEARIIHVGGRYECQHCGCAWQAESVRVFWPIALKLTWNRYARRNWFTAHLWQIGWDGIERRVFGMTLHLGPLKIVFGRQGGRS